MLSLDRYARSVYRYAPDETEAHIARTVLAPLALCDADSCSGSSSSCNSSASLYYSIFAVPPATTNVRFVGPDIAEQAAAVCAELSGTPVRCVADRLGRVGLPYCVCVRPVAAAVTEWPPLLAHLGGTSQSNTDNNHISKGASAGSDAAVVVVLVDAGCGEAVLRGADVFAPGIASATGHFAEGQRVIIGVYLEKQQVGTGAAVELSFRFKFSAAFAPAPEALVVQTINGHDDDKSDGAATVRRHVVIVGEGVAKMDRKTVYSRGTHGVAVEVAWTPLLQPSQPILARLLAGAEESDRTTTATTTTGAPSVFLQNYTSMVPAQLLATRVGFSSGGERPTLLLDACAAPGGKTSQLLSLMKAKRDYHNAFPSQDASVAAAAVASFRLVCCERSQPRYKSLVSLLQSHFPEAGANDGSGGSGGFLSETLVPLCTDVNKLPQALDECGAEPSLPAAFDGILLDPPCTGMGLRPRLQPNVTTLKLILDHADYQRALFRSCMRFLSTTTGDVLLPQPTIVYSTCTITAEENEANVLHFLESNEGLRLARARCPAEVALCYMGAASGYGADGKQRFLLQDEIMHIQREREGRGSSTSCNDDDATAPVAAVDDAVAPVLVLRFMPRREHTAGFLLEDSVGFFVAVFERP